MSDLVGETNHRVQRLIGECRVRVAPFARWSWFWPFRRGQEQWAALLRSKNRDERLRALGWCLVNHDNISLNEPLENDLVRLAREGDAYERQLACAMLWEMGGNVGESSVATLICALEDSDSLVRDIAACAIRNRSHGNMAVRMLVAVVLNQFDGRSPGAVPGVTLQRAMAALIPTVECCEKHFRSFLNEDRRDDEMAAVMQDEYWRPLQDDMRNSLSKLAVLLKENSSPMQGDTAYCMALFGSEFDQAIAAMASVTVENPTAEQLQRWNTLAGIHGARCAAAIPALRHCMAHADTMVRERVANAIAEMGELALPALLGCLQDSHPRVREAAALCLSRKMGFPSNLYQKCAPALPILRELLSDEDPEVCVAAAEALRISELQPQVEPGAL